MRIVQQEPERAWFEVHHKHEHALVKVLCGEVDAPLTSRGVSLSAGVQVDRHANHLDGIERVELQPCW